MANSTAKLMRQETGRVPEVESNALGVAGTPPAVVTVGGAAACKQHVKDAEVTIVLSFYGRHRRPVTGIVT